MKRGKTTASKRTSDVGNRRQKLALPVLCSGDSHAKVAGVIVGNF